MTSIDQTLANGYSESTPRVSAENAERNARDLAAVFQEDGRMERLIRLRSEDRDEYKSIVSGFTRVALANYENAKAAHDKYSA
jgi:hypothetical protein